MIPPKLIALKRATETVFAGALNPPRLDAIRIELTERKSTFSEIERDSAGRLVTSHPGAYPYQTRHPQIFAGGDAVRGADLVVTAMDDGRQAASSIIAWLENRDRAVPGLSPEGGPRPLTH